ncbi:hypothetical protein [Haloarcula sebkhae]|uniref:Uncharacterized protein n=2 Tax=Haloarcula sebkhae TaxID=932660 RepID=A0ACC6VJD4_9EURY|nr:hypothetical protein [Haloarcula sebkhae]GGK74512.1 hypothetical protein GCM10009067_28370 [Haloarcula sebkhae]
MPGLTDSAILEVDVVDETGDTRTCAFQVKEELEDTGNVAKTYLIGSRGQYLRAAYEIADKTVPGELADENTESRRGYFVDGGAGQYVEQIAGKAGDRDLQWGDGSTDPTDPNDISKYDATGCDTLAQKQIFEYVISQSKTGSLGQARLYWGQWSDGTYADSAGAFGRPLTVAIIETNVTDDPDDPNAIDVSITAEWAAVLPEAVVDEAESVAKDINEIIPER